MSALAITPNRNLRAGPRQNTLSFATQPTIRTNRLTLRALKPEDQYRLATGMQTPEVVRMLLPVPVPYNHEDGLDFVRAWQGGEIDGWAYAITLDGGALEGVISIEHRETGKRPGWHIGYWLLPTHWGKGYMSEAASALIERFFSIMMGETLYAGVITDNPASLKVQEKLGFSVTGTTWAFCNPRGTMVDVVETELTFGSFMPA
ncbi:GNAT family N-acetyltransferase [Rhizobium sp. L1K21]|uniref:GNAT family N-acetyltransferase n=1 Tax=Rhizobium sp. L1K21 TaxID=2954933 RepID=UPI0020925CEF|nr:GNAT family N-acetyltransferase [Rhizobium sp. L1K21]MCO6184828.1 GNAT family N-acetyltransferase [Rhizobium sp. L1K21]